MHYFICLLYIQFNVKETLKLQVVSLCCGLKMKTLFLKCVFQSKSFYELSGFYFTDIYSQVLKFLTYQKLKTIKMKNNCLFVL